LPHRGAGDPALHQRAMPAQDQKKRLHLPQRAVALVLAGDSGGRRPRSSGPRAPIAAHFGGKFRTVDFALSNCLNSGIRRVGVITPNKSHSLVRHLERGWSFLKSEANEFVALLPPRPGHDEELLCRGSADALSHNQDLLERYDAEFLLVLGGDHIYKMNYAMMLADHVAKGRECTVACIEVPRDAASSFGVLGVDEHWRITDFDYRPAAPLCAPGCTDRSLASMEIYIFNAKYLVTALARDQNDTDSSHDLGKDIVARAVRDGHAAAHPFALSCVGTAPGSAPYWRNVASTDAYWEANIDLTSTAPELDLYDSHWPIRTHHAELAPAKFLHNQPDRRGMAVESLVAGGCVVSGSVLRSVLFSAVRVHSYASVEWSVLLPDVKVGRGARLHRVVVARGCTIPDGLVIGEDAAVDAERFFRSDIGITLVTADMLARLPPQPCATS
jgi:glucose-1-phosphate adenylyltransferase